MSEPSTLEWKYQAVICESYNLMSFNRRPKFQMAVGIIRFKLACINCPTLTEFFDTY